MLSNRTKRVFLSIAKGKIAKKNLETGVIENYDNLEGRFKGITKREANFADGKCLVFDFTFEDGGETFVISCPAAGGVARGIILSLANIPEPGAGRIKISTYLKGDYTNTAVYFNGENIRWIDAKVPPIETFSHNGKEFTDDSERVLFVDNLVKTINGRLNAGAPAQEREDIEPSEEFGDDMPDM